MSLKVTLANDCVMNRKYLSEYGAIQQEIEDKANRTTEPLVVTLMRYAEYLIGLGIVGGLMWVLPHLI